jgi:hypothetical protein
MGFSIFYYKIANRPLPCFRLIRGKFLPGVGVQPGYMIMPKMASFQLKSFQQGTEG